MAWDSRRTVPWKRIGVLLAIYAGVVVAITAISRPTKLASSLTGVAFGVVFAGALLVVMAKFGWTMPILKSRTELAAERSAREATRTRAKAKRGGEEVVEGPRPRPAPTKRTSTGPSQHPRPANRRK